MTVSLCFMYLFCNSRNGSQDLMQSKYSSAALNPWSLFAQKLEALQVLAVPDHRSFLICSLQHCPKQELSLKGL